MFRKMGVWLDSEKAFLISLTDSGEYICKIDSEVENRLRYPGEKKSFHRLGGMLSNPENVHGERRRHQLHDYFLKVMDNMKDADEIFLFGPSKTKEWLEKELTKNSEMASKLCGTASADRITEKQMVARVKDFFRENDEQKRHIKKQRRWH